MKLKYIRFEYAGFVMFTEVQTHAEVARAFQGDTPMSAGFCSFAPDGSATCFGNSVSLNLEPLEADSERLTYWARGY